MVIAWYWVGWNSKLLELQNWRLYDQWPWWWKEHVVDCVKKSGDLWSNDLRCELLVVGTGCLTVVLIFYAGCNGVEWHSFGHQWAATDPEHADPRLRQWRDVIERQQQCDKSKVKWVGLSEWRRPTWTDHSCTRQMWATLSSSSLKFSSQ